MIKNKTHMISCAMFLAIACTGLVACGSENSSGPSQKVHDSTKWFTEEELSEKGLAGLTAPTGLSGKINSSDTWFNDGYSFSQVCPDESTFNANAETYFSYFKTNYAGMFGVPRFEKYSKDTNEYWYIIEQKSELADFLITIRANCIVSIMSGTIPWKMVILSKARFGFSKFDMNLIRTPTNINSKCLSKVPIPPVMGFTQTTIK